MMLALYGIVIVGAAFIAFNFDDFTSENQSSEQSEETRSDKDPSRDENNEQNNENVSAQTFELYFPNNSDEFTSTQAVTRVSATNNKIGFVLQSFFEGPTSAEEEQGILSLNEFEGESNCGGSLYQYSVNSGTVTVRLCRTYSSGGVGADARFQSALTDTLLNLEEISEVIILDKDGNCFGDQSGMNVCL